MYAAVNEFLNKDLLPRPVPTTRLSPVSKPDPDLKVRTALDRAVREDRRAIHATSRSSKPRSGRRSPRHTSSSGSIQQALLHAQRALGLAPANARRIRPRNAEDEAPGWYCLLSDGRLAEAEPLLLQAMDGLRDVPATERLRLLDATHSCGAALFCTRQARRSRTTTDPGSGWLCHRSPAPLRSRRSA